MARRLGSLGESQPAALLDGAEAAGAVRAGTREDDANRALTLIAGEGLEEGVDGAAPLGPCRLHAETAPADFEQRARRNDVDMIGCCGRIVLYCEHGQKGASAEQLGE